MKKPLLLVTLVVLSACGSGASNPSAPLLTPASHKVHRDSASFVYVGVATPQSGNGNDVMTLDAYPAGVNTSAPTYSRSYQSVIPNSLYLGLVSTAVDSKGHVYVAAVTPEQEYSYVAYNNIDELSSDLSTKIRTISIFEPEYLTVDGSDNLWVYTGVKGGGGIIHEYNSQGVFLQQFGTPANGNSPCWFNYGGIGLDSAGNLYLNCYSTIYERLSSTKSWTALFEDLHAYGNALAVSRDGAHIYLADASTASGVCEVAVWSKSASVWTKTFSQIGFLSNPCEFTYLSVDASGIVYPVEANPSDGAMFEWDSNSPASAWYKIQPSGEEATPAGGATAN